MANKYFKVVAHSKFDFIVLELFLEGIKFLSTLQ